ncbi:MAG: hypothetical protein C7B45_09750 [Sulfobacillus acidophilus]|uniref:ATP-binding cassette domain-containing protein n=1 Tax=Sulfobacillus acidophilus TaxID=53633 RepID=A0A2T2WHG6_9FIRM|nr:MAG: hypothetical protein C7B45_09750 [Sulfobacillus acidophilus]
MEPGQDHREDDDGVQRLLQSARMHGMTVTDTRRRRWIPEVVQTSAVDCGPAALTALLRGLGMSVDYDRVREACRTAVDGTSIDAIEDLARALGFEAKQIMLPAQQLLDPLCDAFPAIVVVRLPSGWPHFVVVWQRYGKFLQIMDPAVGRRWVPATWFQDELLMHRLLVPASDYEAYLKSDPVRNRFHARLTRLGLGAQASAWIESACSKPGWESMARIDAAVSAAEAEWLNRPWHRRFRRPDRETLVALTADGGPPIAPRFYTARPVSDAFHSDEGSGPMLALTGAVAVRIRKQPPTGGEEAVARPTSPDRFGTAEVRAILTTSATRPAHVARSLILANRWWLLLGVAIGMMISGIAFFVEALIFSHAWHLVPRSAQPRQFLVLMGILAGVALIDWPATVGIWAIGRRVEIRLRERLSEKITWVHHSFLQTRPTSDLLSRTHLIHHIRRLPLLVGRLLRVFGALAATAGGIVWLAPQATLPAILAAIISVIVPWSLAGPLREQDFRRRVQDGALSHFTLDALLGIVPLTTHNGTLALKFEHEEVLGAWRRSSLAFSRAATLAEALQLVVAYAFSAWLVIGFLPPHPARALLFIYLALSMPAWGREFTMILREYPQDLNILRRLLEPLAAPNDPAWAPTFGTTDTKMSESPFSPISLECTSNEGLDGIAVGSRRPSSGADIMFASVGVTVGGKSVLREINVHITAGEHLAIVGPSGAGKSTLIATLLGFLPPTEGELRVDNSLLTGRVLEHLRKSTAWVGPTVTLWNRSLRDNILYGADDDPRERELRVQALLAQARLAGLPQDLPFGLDTILGEGGTLVSGGEGQRIRFARALGRASARLVLLDEPFAGLDWATRQDLLTEARRQWANATLLYITHDLRETQHFSRVLVMEGGTIVQDGGPRQLRESSSSRYAALWHAESQAVQALSRAPWRRLTLLPKRFAMADDESSPLGPVNNVVPEHDAPPDSGQDPQPGQTKDARIRIWRALGHLYLACRRMGSFSDRTASKARSSFGAFWERVVNSDSVLGLATMVAHGGFYIMYLLMWAVAGAAALHGSFPANGRALWLALLAGLIMVQAAATRLAGSMSIRIGLRLKRRLLDQVTHLSPDNVHRSGIGTYLGILFESETLQTLTFSGGYGGLLSVLELAATIWILAISGFPHVIAALACWCALVAFLGLRYCARFWDWTQERLALTTDLAERLVGHHTRLVQSASLAEEDADHRRRLARYERISHRLDRLAAVLSSLLPQGWLVLGGAEVLLTARSSSTTSSAVALGGVLLGWQAISRLTGSTAQIAQAWSSWRQLQPMLASSRTAPFPAERSNAVGAGDILRTSESEQNGILEARSLEYRHPGRRKPVLENVGIVLSPGDRVVISGPSGSGKSTQLALLARLREATNGTLILAGLEASAVAPTEWRRKVVLVPQTHENHLFGASVAFNLFLGKAWPPQKSDLDKVFPLLTDLGLQELLLRMPAGLGQILGETGWQLSQGERSRLWLVRALLQQPDVLLLDEGLDVMDPEVRLRVISFLERFPGAVVVAAHD